jgi:Putative metal-binding motif
MNTSWRWALGVIAALLVASVAAAGGNGQGKQDVCHVTGNGSIVVINVADAAVPAHLDHGDHLPFDVWPDVDGDGFGDASAAAVAVCAAAEGEVDNGLDCNDADAAVNPSVAEVCDGIDNDCNGEIDEGGICVSCPCFTAEDLEADPLTRCESHPDTAQASTVAGDSAACGGSFTATSASVRLFCRFAGPQASSSCQVVNTGMVSVTPEESEACEDLIAGACAVDPGDPCAGEVCPSLCAACQDQDCSGQVNTSNCAKFTFCGGATQCNPD